MEQFSAYKQEAGVHVNEFVRSVYNWMCLGLGLTGLIAWYVSGNDAIRGLIINVETGSVTPLFWLIAIAELGLVFSISGMVNRMSGSIATGLFLLYSALNGVTLSFIFLVYTRASIVSTFFICALTFLACSIYGWTTKKDLTSLGSFMFMGLIGILIASVFNIFMRSPAVYYAVSYIGVVVFVGLTAYDTQKIKNMALTQPAGLDGDVVRKGAILGALALYLDFINLFLMLLRIFGGSRD
ncbi:Bax inhibitor-1/YccA family protein [Thermodesulfobacteriota bacterium]